jgi:hypothetical protein
MYALVKGQYAETGIDTEKDVEQMQNIGAIYGFKARGGLVSVPYQNWK